jgi:DNA-binding PadR family transcriptional regulator
MHMTLFQILAVLNGNPSDALEVIHRLKEMTPTDVPSLPAFYRHLRRGMDAGWIVVEGTGQPEGAPGRPRQIYGLTSEGRAALRHRARDLNAFTLLALKGQGRS